MYLEQVPKTQFERLCLPSPAALLLGLLMVAGCGTPLPDEANQAYPGTDKNKSPYNLVVQCKIPDAIVYRLGPADQGNWLPLRQVNVPFTVNSETPDRTKIAVGGPLVNGRPGPVAGYLPKESEIQFFPPNGTSYFFVANGTKVLAWCFPRPDQPLELEPAPGPEAALERFLYLLGQNLTALVCLGTLLSVALLAWLSKLPERKRAAARLRRERELLEKFSTIDPDADPFLNRCFSSWRTVERLGQGGMAVVYRAVPEDTLADKDSAALKVMNADYVRDEDYRRRFRREIQISQSLEHPNVVRPIEGGEQSGVLYLVMELVLGKPLRDLIPHTGYPLVQGLEIAIAICNGLIHAHSKGIVHRDLKPENVMITHKGLVKVMDLGLARAPESESVTRTGDTFGTPAYMSPEQIAGGGGLMASTDQYSLGIILFELLSGRRPFLASEPLAVVLQQLNDDPPLLRNCCKHATLELETLVSKMLAKDPSSRYANLTQVRVIMERELERARKG